MLEKEDFAAVSHLCLVPPFHKRLSKSPEVGIIGIFVLPGYENELELATSDTSLNLLSPFQI